jgi:hypothetical protein
MILGEKRRKTWQINRIRGNSGATGRRRSTPPARAGAAVPRPAVKPGVHRGAVDRLPVGAVENVEGHGFDACGHIHALIVATQNWRSQQRGLPVSQEIARPVTINTVAENQLDAVGILVAKVNDEWDAQGSCFLFRSDALALTAAHCVPQELEPFAVQLPHLGTTLPVERIERHPTADIAMLFCSAEDTLSEIGVPTTAFLDGDGNWSVGDTFYAYGYPTEGPTEDSTQAPVPRLFTGNFQRFMPYVSPRGYRFLAGEMSIPAPSGLSGGPLFKPWGQGPWFSPQAPQIVLGLVAANLDSYAVTDSISEVNDDGTEYREESRRVIRYGVAVMLSGVADWLNERSPKRQPHRPFHLQQA